MLYGPSSSASASRSAGSPADLEEEDRIQAARYRRTPDFDCNFYCTNYRHVLGCPTAKKDLRDRKSHEKAFDDYIEAMGAMSNGRTGALSLSEAVKEAAASGNAAPAVSEWLFTFGFGHVAPDGTSLARKYVRIRGTYASARAEMLSRFGRQWAFQYADDDEAGVERHGLIEWKP